MLTQNTQVFLEFWLLATIIVETCWVQCIIRLNKFYLFLILVAGLADFTILSSEWTFQFLLRRCNDRIVFQMAF